MRTSNEPVPVLASLKPQPTSSGNILVYLIFFFLE
jgi:hypothetical protein